MSSAVRPQDRVAKNALSPRESVILKLLRDLAASGRGSTPIDLNEIGQQIGVRDSDEVLRSLYTLEGKSLVEPDPPGDLTSARWRVTPLGMKAAEILAL